MDQPTVANSILTIMRWNSVRFVTLFKKFFLFAFMLY